MLKFKSNSKIQCQKTSDKIFILKKINNNKF